MTNDHNLGLQESSSVVSGGQKVEIRVLARLRSLRRL